MADIDWSLLKQPTDPVTAYVGGLQTGRQLGQQQRVINALKNYDPTNPTPTVNSLLQVGAIPEASGIADVGYKNTQRQILGAGMNALLQTQQPSASAAPQSASTQAPDATAAPVAQPSVQPLLNGAPQPDLSQLDPAHKAQAIQTADTLDQLGLQLSQLPYAQRKAALSAETSQLVAHGLNADQIATFDPTDENIAGVHAEMAQLRGMLGSGQAPQVAEPDNNAMAASGSPQSTPGIVPSTAPIQPASPVVPAATSQAATAATAAGSSGSPAINLRDPQTVRAIEMMSMGGANVDPLIALGNANLHKYSATRSGNIFDESSGQFVRSGPNEQGIQFGVDQNGNISTAENVPGYVNASAAQAEAKAAAEARGKLEYAAPLAQAEAGGKGSGEAPYEMVDVKMPADANHPGGYEAQMTLAQFKALGGGTRGAVAGAGQSAGPGAENFAEHDAAAYSHTLATVADPTTMIGYQNKATTATQAVNSAMALSPNAGTPATAKLASLLNVVGLDSKQANNLSYYSSLIPQVTRGSFATFPRLEKEFELVKDAIPGLSTPRDAAALTFASIAATNNRNAAYSKFAASYQGIPSQRALNQAWLASPQSQMSLFADPVFKNLTMDGKPAVYINPTAAPNGHTYGVFRPGTSNAQTFLVK